MLATVGYRGRLAGMGRRSLRCALISILGSLCGALLLLVLPPAAFDTAVPYVVGGATLLVVVDSLAPRRRRRPRLDKPATLTVSLFPACIYGGYFGAAQGVVLMAILDSLSDLSMQEVNAIKNLMTFCANLTASILFIVVTDVAFAKAFVVALGAVTGASIASRYVQRAPDRLLRLSVIVIGCLTAGHLVVA